MDYWRVARSILFMPLNHPFNHINNLLCNVCGMIGDTLKVTGYEEGVDEGPCMIRLLADSILDLVVDFFVFFIQF